MAEIKGINHVSFAVKNLDEAMRSAKENLGGEVIMKFENTRQGYKGACVQLGGSIISLIQATTESSFVAEFIKKRGEGVQHIGLEIDNLEEFAKQLELKGVRVDKEGLKSDDFPEALVGPRTGYGVVLQLMEWKGGPMDISPEGKERLKQKYREEPDLRLIE